MWILAWDDSYSSTALAGAYHYRTSNNTTGLLQHSNVAHHILASPPHILEIRLALANQIVYDHVLA